MERIKCGVKVCRNRSKKHGVCGVHKTWLYISESSEFDKEFEGLRLMTKELFDEGDNMEKNGVNPLHIQNYMGLFGNEKEGEIAFPSEFSKLGNLLIRTKNYAKDMQTRYDPGLVYNMGVRMRHSFLPYTCTCSYCSLGK